MAQGRGAIHRTSARETPYSLSCSPHGVDLGYANSFLLILGSLTGAFFRTTTGPLAGGPFPPGDNHPRSVNEEYYKRVSEGKDIARLSIKELNEGLEGKPTIAILEKYVRILKDTPEGCVELFGGSEHPFDFWYVQLLCICVIYTCVPASYLILTNCR